MWVIILRYATLVLQLKFIMLVNTLHQDVEGPQVLDSSEFHLGFKYLVHTLDNQLIGQLFS